METLIKPTHRKAEETLEIEPTKSRETLSFKAPKHQSGLKELECLV